MRTTENGAAGERCPPTDGITLRQGILLSKLISTIRDHVLSIGLRRDARLWDPIPWRTVFRRIRKTPDALIRQIRTSISRCDRLPDAGSNTRADVVAVRRQQPTKCAAPEEVPYRHTAARHPILKLCDKLLASGGF